MKDGHRQGVVRVAEGDQPLAVRGQRLEAQHVAQREGADRRHGEDRDQRQPPGEAGFLGGLGHVGHPVLVGADAVQPRCAEALPPRNPPHGRLIRVIARPPRQPEL
jgi:hypothetical protein